MANPEPPDMFDDDYWFGRDGRKAKDFAVRFDSGMRRIESLGAHLREEAHREYVEREAGTVEGGTDAGAK